LIGLDTNVLVRYLAQDDPVQSRRATEIIEQQLTRSSPGFVSIATILELAWVLKSIYLKPKEEVVAAIRRLIETDNLVIQNEVEVYQAQDSVMAGIANFEDALIGALGRWAGCSSTLTFDRKALRHKAFKAA
jgi:predicted nucleic-acid-binding protein